VTPSRLKLALANVWNLAAMGACAALAAITRSPAPLFAGAALEGAWLVFATRPNASRAIFRGAHARADAAALAQRRSEQVRTLRPEDADRLARLDERREQIQQLAGDNAHVARDVLVAEVSRLDDFVDDFLELAVTSTRWDAYLANVDEADLESETRRWEDAAARAADEDERALAKQNLEVLLERRAKLDEMRRRLARARAQLELIEQTFRMIADEIMLMRDATGLRDRLDDLVVGVRAVREMSAPESESSPEAPSRAAQARAAAQPSQATRR
jgi:hypothetical protein